MIQSGGMSCIIKKDLNDTYSRVRIGSHLSHMFAIGNALKKETLYRYGFSTFL